MRTKAGCRNTVDRRNTVGHRGAGSTVTAHTHAGTDRWNAGEVPETHRTLGQVGDTLTEMAGTAATAGRNTTVARRNARDLRGSEVIWNR
jgi:hypothetical protein